MTDRHPLFSRSGSAGRATGTTLPPSPCKIGLALGGGFARGIAHAGVLKVLEERNIPIHWSPVSAPVRWLRLRSRAAPDPLT